MTHKLALITLTLKKEDLLSESLKSKGVGLGSNGLFLDSHVKITSVKDNSFTLTEKAL